MGYKFTLPKLSDLTSGQKLALQESEPIALIGGPGTGKTVVSLRRHIRNYELYKRKSLLLTYTKTLEYFLKHSASENEEASNNISRTYLWTSHPVGNNYDEIIVDEAQDVECDKYNTVKNYSNQVSYGADDAQQVFMNKGCGLNSLKSMFPDNIIYELDRNFRNSREILEFTKAVFPDKHIPVEVINDSLQTDKKPIAKVLGFSNFENKVVESIVDITKIFSEESHNIGILFPIVKWVDDYYQLLREKNIICSKYKFEEDDFNTLERIHLTTFKSAKGLEFDTVIIPKFDSHRWVIDNPTMKNITENDYYVGLTRAKRNLFLLCKESLGHLNNTYKKE